MKKNRAFFHHWLYLLLLAIFLGNTAVSAQDNTPTDPAENQIRPFRPSTQFRHLSTDDGLPVNEVNAILQDSTGFVWIGTSDGLSRYDGYSLTTFKHEADNENSLGNNQVHEIVEDDEGILWIATEGGASRFNPHTEQFTRYQHDPSDPNSLAGNTILSTFHDSQGNIWFGSLPENGLHRLNPATGQMTRFLPSNSTMQRGATWGITEAPNGTIWLITDRHLQNYDPVTETFAGFLASADERRLSDLVVDEDGRLWLGGSNGLYLFDPQTEEMRQIEGVSEVNSLFLGENGRLWIGTSRNGLIHFDRNTATILQRVQTDPTNPLSLSSNTITSIYQDRSGLVWLGTRDGGINLVHPAWQQFANYRHQLQNDNSLAVPDVNHISGDQHGNLWAVHGGRFSQVNLATGIVTHHRTNDFITVDQAGISSVLADSHGEVWFGLSDGKLMRLDPVTATAELVQLYEEQTPLNGQAPPQPIVGLLEDAQGNLWIAATRDGLYRLDNSRQLANAYLPPNPGKPVTETTLAAPQLNAIASDSTGHIWLGYTNGQLSRLDPSSSIFSHFLFGPENSSRSIEDILVDEDGRIWLATSEGLANFDPPTDSVTLFTEDAGFSSTFTEAILRDEDGYLWVSSRRGLARFDPQNGRVVARFDEANGLGGDEFNRAAKWVDANGRFYFGHNSGFTTFNPQNITENLYQPPVVLTSLRVFNELEIISPNSRLTQPFWETDTLTFAPEDDVISFDFAALSYAAPEKIQYRYRLDGFETSWNEVSSERRFATYTFLPAGTYTFRVQATYGNGLWSEAEATLTVIVKPPWWETWWFQITAVALGISILVTGIRWRTYSIRQRNRELESQVALRTEELATAKEKAEVASHAKSEFLANMSHELRTPLNGVLGYAQILQRDGELTDKQRDGLQTIYNSGRHLLTLINDVLDLSKIEARRLEIEPAELNLPAFLEGITDMMKLAAAQKRLNLHSELGPDLPTVILADEKRLRQVLLNLLGNAVKFTETGIITFQVTCISPLKPNDASPGCSLRFAVEDSGIGIATEKLRTIFRPFEQTGTVQTQAEGTGLGLPISQQLVQLMGGEIQVSSELGSGSRFWFDVDFMVLSETAVSPPTSSPLISGYLGPRRRILVVDDRPENRLVLANLLEPAGFEVALAENGQEAVEKVAKVQPDLIFIDLVMPVMMGFEAVAIIRQMPQFTAVPIIAVSASVLDADKETSREVGCDDFLNKPVEADRLFALLQTYLQLTWQYDVKEAENLGRETAVTSEETITPPPQTELETLFTLARFGNMDHIREQANHLQTLSPQYHTFANTLKQLADAYEDEKILAFIGRFLPANSGQSA